MAGAIRRTRGYGEMEISKVPRSAKRLICFTYCCPARGPTPHGEDGAFQQSAIPLPFQSSHPACINR